MGGVKSLHSNSRNTGFRSTGLPSGIRCLEENYARKRSPNSEAQLSQWSAEFREGFPVLAASTPRVSPKRCNHLQISCSSQLSYAGTQHKLIHLNQWLKRCMPVFFSFRPRPQQKLCRELKNGARFYAKGMINCNGQGEVINGTCLTTNGQHRYPGFGPVSARDSCGVHLIRRYLHPVERSKAAIFGLGTGRDVE